MKKTFRTSFIIIFSIYAIGQTVAVQAPKCGFLKNLKFKNGVDTLEIKARYDGLLEGSDQTFLRMLAKKKKIEYNEYVINDYDSNSIEFTPIGCDSSYQGTLSRKIYDNKFIRKTYDIREYTKEIVDIDTIKTGRTLLLKCAIFEDQDVYYHNCFFTIIDLEVL